MEAEFNEVWNALEFSCQSGVPKNVTRCFPFLPYYPPYFQSVNRLFPLLSTSDDGSIRSCGAVYRQEGDETFSIRSGGASYNQEVDVIMAAQRIMFTREGKAAC
jgi:hypothetical protein